MRAMRFRLDLRWLRILRDSLGSPRPSNSRKSMRNIFDTTLEFMNDLPQWTAVAARPSDGEVLSGCHRNALPSVVKSVANLDKDFAGIQIVCSAEGEAVIQQNAAVCDIHPLNVYGEVLAEALA
jgi:hypothetical protein